MQTRREFLTRSGSLMAGLAAVPGAAFSGAAGRPDAGDVNLVREHSFVLVEAKVFEQEYLPVLLAKRPIAVWPHGRPNRAPTRAEWQTAARRLWQAPLTKQQADRRRHRSGAWSPARLVPFDGEEFEPLFRSCIFKLDLAPNVTFWLKMVA